IRHFNDDDQARLLGGLADVQFRLGHAEEARALWQRLAANPRQRGDLRLRLLLFDLALRDGDEARMRKALEDIRTVEQSSGENNREAEADLELKKLKKSIVEQGDMGRLAVNVALQRKEYALALTRARTVVRHDTKDPRDLVWKARVYAIAGKAKEAEDCLRQA